MNLKLNILLLITLFAACAPKKEDVKKASPIIGTWQLISATTTQKDSTFSTFNPNNKMIKIITPTHFAFFNHDVKMGKDSATAAFNAGGGPYTLVDSLYTEHLEYFNEREWENHTFPFTVTVKKDTFIQQGIEKVAELGIERLIVEKYIRVKN